MPSKRQQHFREAVVKAASNAQPTKQRGKPNPQNLTAKGRFKGLSAMRTARRCRCTN